MKKILVLLFFATAFVYASSGLAAVPLVTFYNNIAYDSLYPTQPQVANYRVKIGSYSARGKGASFLVGSKILNVATGAVTITGGVPCANNQCTVSIPADCIAKLQHYYQHSKYGYGNVQLTGLLVQLTDGTWQIQGNQHGEMTCQGWQ